MASSSRSLLYIGAGALLVAAVVLLLKLRHGPAAPAADSPVATAAPTAPAPPIASARPHLPADAPAQREGPARNAESSPAKVYEIDGKEIRDHRSGDHPPMDIPPNVHPPEAHRIDPQITSAIMAQLTAAVHDCGQAVPPEAREAKPRAEGQVVIAITGNKVAVTRSTIQLRGVLGASEDPVKACIEERANKITTSSTNEPDLTDYSINVSVAML